MEKIDKINRRKFFKQLTAFGVTSFALSKSRDINSTLNLLNSTPAFSKEKSPAISVSSKGKPAELVRKAIDAVGGIKKYVKKGDYVVVKPNAAWARKPEYAATTNPEVVEEVIKLCYEAGAKKVEIIEYCIDKPTRLVYKITGIEEVAKKTGASLPLIRNKNQFVEIEIPKGKLITQEAIIKEVKETDVFINIPIAKEHSDTGLTLGMKNLMGIIWNRQAWHNSQNIHQCIADFSTALKPDLIIVDAVNILLTNGPKGPGKTKHTNKIIAGTDPVAVDSYAATLFGKNGADIEHLKFANKMEVGEINLEKVDIKEM